MKSLLILTNEYSCVGNLPLRENSNAEVKVLKFCLWIELFVIYSALSVKKVVVILDVLFSNVN